MMCERAARNRNKQTGSNRGTSWGLGPGDWGYKVPVLPQREQRTAGQLTSHMVDRDSRHGLSPGEISGA